MLVGPANVTNLARKTLQQKMADRSEIVGAETRTRTDCGPRNLLTVGPVLTVVSQTPRRPANSPRRCGILARAQAGGSSPARKYVVAAPCHALAPSNA